MKHPLNKTKNRLILSFALLAIVVLSIGATPVYAVEGAVGSTAEALTDVMRPLMAILIQGAAFFSIYFAFKVGGSLLSITTQGISRFGKMGGGGKKGGGGGDRKGIRGKIAANTQQRRSEYAAGARGNSATRAITAPGSRMTRKSRALATAEFEQQTAAAGKQLEEQGVTDPEALKNLASHGDSSGKLRRRINELQNSPVYEEDGVTRDTKAEQRNQQTAAQLERAVPFAGKRTHQAAAFKGAAASAFVGNKDGSLSRSFDHMDELFSDNTAFRDSLKTQAAVAANKEGRKDIWAKHGPLPGATARERAGNVTKGMSREDFRKLAPASLSDPDFAAGLRDQVDPSSEQYNESAHNYLAGALSDYDGIGAAKHDEYRKVLGDDLYSSLVAKGNSPGPSGGSTNGGSQAPSTPSPSSSSTGGGQSSSPSTTSSSDAAWKHYDDMHARLTNNLGREPSQREIRDQYADETGKRYTDTGGEWQRNPDGSWSPKQ